MRSSIARSLGSVALSSRHCIPIHVIPCCYRVSLAQCLVFAGSRRWEIAGMAVSNAHLKDTVVPLLVIVDRYRQRSLIGVVNTQLTIRISLMSRDHVAFSDIS